MIAEIVFAILFYLGVLEGKRTILYNKKRKHTKRSTNQTIGEKETSGMKIQKVKYKKKGKTIKKKNG